MRGLGILLVLIGVGYLVYTQYMPRVREREAAEAGANVEGERSSECLQLANRASSTFSSDLRQFSRPPIDQTLWAGFLLNLSSELSAADTACSCPTETCRSASAALHELRGLVNDLDTFIRTAGPPITDATNRLGTVHRMLERAARELR